MPADAITVDLSPEMSEIVHAAVAAGEYADVASVVDAALQGWREGREELLGLPMDELRRLGDEGEASGPAVEIDKAAIMADIRLRALASKPEA